MLILNILHIVDISVREQNSEDARILPQIEKARGDDQYIGNKADQQPNGTKEFGSIDIAPHFCNNLRIEFFSQFCNILCVKKSSL